MNVNLYVLKDYRKKMISQSKKTNPIQSQFQNPTQSQRQAYFAHQKSRVDLPLGKSKQTVTSRPSICQVWLCNCSILLTLRSWIGFLLITSFGAFAKFVFARTVNRVVANGALNVMRPPCFSICVNSLAAQYREISLFFIQSRLSYLEWIRRTTSLKILKPISSPL